MPNDPLKDRDRLVLAKYLIEAGSKERQLETALQGQIALARNPLLEHALTDHLAVTRRQITAIDKRVAALGADTSGVPGVEAAEAVVSFAAGIANKGLALAKLPLQALRGTSPADNELRAARDCYWNEAEEIAHYRVLETVAAQLGDTETAQLAERHRKEEEEMQHHLEGLLAGLVRSVVATEASDDVPVGSAQTRSHADETAARSRSGSSRSRSTGSSRSRGATATASRSRAKPTAKR